MSTKNYPNDYDNEHDDMLDYPEKPKRGKRKRSVNQHYSRHDSQHHNARWILLGILVLVMALAFIPGASLGIFGQAFALLFSFIGSIIGIVMTFVGVILTAVFAVIGAVLGIVGAVLGIVLGIAGALVGMVVFIVPLIIIGGALWYFSRQS